MNYEDNPGQNLEYLRSLTKDQLKIYIKGYLMACAHMREAFSKGKYELLTKVMMSKGPPKRDLLILIGLLDKYEKAVKDKEHKMLGVFPEIPRSKT